MNHRNPRTNREEAMNVNPISMVEYQCLTPYGQGYASYMQGAWNPDVPGKNPFVAGTLQHEQWNEGSFAAMLEVQDYDE